MVSKIYKNIMIYRNRFHMSHSSVP